jgi:PAS domain S-box-containing protein
MKNEKRFLIQGMLIRLIRPYLFALMVIFVAAILRLWPLQSLGLRTVWVTFYPSVMIVALFAGTYAGLFSTLLSCIIALFFWPLFVDKPFINDFGDWLSLIIFMVTCSGISIISGVVKQSREKIKLAELNLRKANEDLENRVKERILLLSKSEERYRSTMDNMMEGCQMLDFDWKYIYINDAADIHNHRPKEELIGHRYKDMWPGIEDTEVFRRIQQCLYDRSHHHMENEFLFPDGNVGWFDLRIQAVPEGVFILSVDITDYKRAEAKIKTNYDAFISMLDSYPGILKIIDPDSYEIILVNRNYSDKIANYYKGQKCYDAFYGFKTPCPFCTNDIIKNNNRQQYVWEHFSPVEKKYYLFTDQLIKWPDGRDVRFEIGIDITGLKKAEEALKESENKYRNLFTEMTTGFALHRIINNNEGIAVDYEFLEINPAFEKLTGLISQKVYGKTAREVIPDIENYWIENYGKVANGGAPMSFTNYSSVFDRHYNVYAFCPKQGYFAAIFSDYTEQKKAIDQINVLNNILEEKNSELEQIIFVASHDLRSPLINIMGFSGELKEQYDSVLKCIEKETDVNIIRTCLNTILRTDAQESLSYIETSADKMNQLISGMLKVSRLGRTEITLEKINMYQLLLNVVNTFEYIIKNENIKIEITEMPDCIADTGLLNQLFTNLIENSIKFRNSSRSLKICISGHEEDKQFVYCVEDNGNGFSAKFMDKIFLLFHRLNNEIEGEGLGLSIVKKITDKHNGKVWAESEIDKGSKFFIALPKI